MKSLITFLAIIVVAFVYHCLKSLSDYLFRKYHK